MTAAGRADGSIIGAGSFAAIVRHPSGDKFLHLDILQIRSVTPNLQGLTVEVTLTWGRSGGAETDCRRLLNCQFFIMVPLDGIQYSLPV